MPDDPVPIRSGERFAPRARQSAHQQLPSACRGACTLGLDLIAQIGASIAGLPPVIISTAGIRKVVVAVRCDCRPPRRDQLSSRPVALIGGYDGAIPERSLRGVDWKDRARPSAIVAAGGVLCVPDNNSNQPRESDRVTIGNEYNDLKLPISETLSAEVLSLPLNTALSPDDADRIVETLNAF